MCKEFRQAIKNFPWMDKMSRLRQVSEYATGHDNFIVTSRYQYQEAHNNKSLLNHFVKWRSQWLKTHKDGGLQPNLSLKERSVS